MMPYGAFPLNRARIPGALAGLLAAALLLVSCSGDGDGSKTSGEDPGTGKKSAEEIAVAARSVSDVTFMTLEGSEKRISDFAGKLLLVNYLETWNADSKKLVPIMNDLQYRRQQHVKVLGIVTDRRISAVKSFLRDNDVQFEVLIPSGEPGLFGKPERLPTTHAVTREGGLYYTIKGLQTRKQYNDFVIDMYRRRM